MSAPVSPFDAFAGLVFVTVAAGLVEPPPTNPRGEPGPVQGTKAPPVASAPSTDAVRSGPIAWADTALVVTNVRTGVVRLGSNPFRVTVRNPGDASVTAVLDLRAEPGMWMIPNMQHQFAVELAPGEERVVDGTYEFRRLSREATLRARVGPGEALEGGGHRLLRVDYERIWEVGRQSPDAYDPDEDFVHVQRGSLELYAWRGSLAARDLERIASERAAAMAALGELLGVPTPRDVRMVFYADEETKIEQTGHRGVGWATGSTVVEVHNDSVQLDPYHELAHIVAAEAGSPPPVLGEGSAIYATERLGADALRHLGNQGRSAHEVTCEALREGRFIPLAELVALDNIGSDESRAALEYAEAGSFVRFLVESRGPDVFRAAYGTLVEGVEVEETIHRLESVSGAGLEELERAWLEVVGHACA